MGCEYLELNTLVFRLDLMGVCLRAVVVLFRRDVMVDG